MKKERESPPFLEVLRLCWECDLGAVSISLPIIRGRYVGCITSCCTMEKINDSLSCAVMLHSSGLSTPFDCHHDSSLWMRSLSASQRIFPLSLFHFLHFYTCIRIIPISCNSPDEPIRKGIVPPIEPHKDSVRFSIYHESSIGNQRNDSSQTLLSHCSISFSLFHLVFFRIMAFSGSHLFFSDFFIIARWRTVIFCGKGICWIAL